ncbi:MAG: AraC family transcriptional regulator ligand-binding domain-containing protein [Myxococcales bacterium]|nr:AraC family transcriptional regulator ligand-binding domain-containing protein [Myxococcales bacterium]
MEEAQDLREFRYIAEALEGRLDTDALAADLGLSPPLRDAAPDPERNLAYDLIRAAVARSGDPGLPLTVGEAIPFGTFDVVDYLASSCDSVGTALDRIARYFGLISTNFRWVIDHDPKLPSAALHCDATSDEERLLFMPFTLGVTFGRFRQLTVGGFRFAKVALALPPPAQADTHRRFFGCPIAYDAEASTCWIPREVWDAPLERREPALRRLLERHAEAQLEQQRVDADPLAPIRNAIREQLTEGPPKLEEVARGVAMSARTLQRRIRDAGTTFQAVVEQERQCAARAYLADPRLGVADVAYLLGYSESSAFVRAFKRWTGSTPAQYRAPSP